MERYGNFRDYYKFNPAENRLKVFESEAGREALERVVSQSLALHPEILVLDVGCNSGELTRRFGEILASSVRAVNPADEVTTRPVVEILAVEKDASLVSKAYSSDAADGASSPNELIVSVDFVCADVLDSDATGSHLRGRLSARGRSEFDLISCFSVLMWIHLNHDDEGLASAVRFLCARTRHLLVELQPWKCYQTAARRMRRGGDEEFPLMRRLNSSKIKKPPDVEAFVLSLIRPFFARETLLGESDSWKRRIYLFSKAS